MKRLLIIGADTYGVVAAEVALEMGCFNMIDFVDDVHQSTPTGIKTVGKIMHINELNKTYSHIIVAVDDSQQRLKLLRKIEEETEYTIATLISPRSYVAPSAHVKKGSIIEPLAIIHALSVVAEGCIVSAGAVIGCACMCCEGVHVDCHATVTHSTVIPAGTKIKCGEVYDRNLICPSELSGTLNEQSQTAIKAEANVFLHSPTPINGRLYSFDDVM